TAKSCRHVSEQQQWNVLAETLHQQPAIVAGLHLEVRDRLDEVGQARVAVVARGETRDGLGTLPELRERGVALFVALRRLVDRAKHLEELRVDGPLALRGGRLLQLILFVQTQSADVDETRASLLEGEGSFGGAEP